MRIGIYNEPQQGGIGGCEYSVAVLADALRLSHQVDIIHHKTALDAVGLAAFSETDLSNVRMRYVDPQPFSSGRARSPWGRYREAEAWHAELSEPYDLFVAFVHGYPPFSRARKAALVVLFPFNKRPGLGNGLPTTSHGAANGLKRLYHNWEWKQRFDSYDARVAISGFTKLWAKRRWGIDCDVIYPPVDTEFAETEKTDRIISIGRFSNVGHSKKHLEMIEAFEAVNRAGLNKWDYVQVGSVGDAATDREYLEMVLRRAARADVRVLSNIARRELRQLLAGAGIFWHAAGLNEDEDRPELAEHFGIVTVEAMAAGCVPVVINRGAQPEIVEHGVSGYLWDSIEELTEYTLLLADNKSLRERMAEAGRARARSFARHHSVSRLANLLMSI